MILRSEYNLCKISRTVYSFVSSIYAGYKGKYQSKALAGTAY